MPTHEDKAVRQLFLRQLCQIHDLRDIRQIIASERNGVGLPSPDECFIVFPRISLQVDQTDIVSRLAARLRHHLEAERFQTQINLGVHEWTGMDCEEFHCRKPPSIARWARTLVFQGYERQAGPVDY